MTRDVKARKGREANIAQEKASKLRKYVEAKIRHTRNKNVCTPARVSLSACVCSGMEACWRLATGATASSGARTRPTPRLARDLASLRAVTRVRVSNPKQTCL